MYDLPQTRQSLIVRLKSNSDIAWSEFLTVYEQAIFRFCRGRGLQDADAKDVTQEVFSALHGRLDTWDAQANRGSFRGWLFQVARNIAVDSIRERSRKPISSEAHLAELRQPQDAEATAFQFEYRRALFYWAAEKVRCEVQATTWRCFWESAVLNRAPVEVAEELGVTIGTLYTAKCRVMARIRERIATLSIVDAVSASDLDTSIAQLLKRSRSDESDSSLDHENQE